MHRTAGATYKGLKRDDRRMTCLEFEQARAPLATPGRRLHAGQNAAGETTWAQTIDREHTQVPSGEHIRLERHRQRQLKRGTWRRVLIREQGLNPVPRGHGLERGMAFAQGLNPYTRDAHLIKPGKGYPAYQVIDVAVYLRVAPRCTRTSRGIRSGIIVLVDGKPVRPCGRVPPEGRRARGLHGQRSGAATATLTSSTASCSKMSCPRHGTARRRRYRRESPAMMCVKAARKGALKVSFPSIFTALAENAQVTVVEQEGMVVDNDTGEILSGETVPEARHGHRGSSPRPTEHQADASSADSRASRPHSDAAPKQGRARSGRRRRPCPH